MSKLENQHVPSESRPHVSRALACRKSEVAERNEALKKAGVVGAYHREDGRLVMHSGAARKAAHQVYKVFDQEAGYSDHAGK